MPRPKKEFYIKDADGLNRRERDFVLYYLASGCRKPKWAAMMAGYFSDHAKRARGLLDQVVIQKVLKKYQPPEQTAFKVTSDPKSIVKRLEEIASCQGINAKTSTIELRALELLMRNQGMLDGTSHEGRDRLKELVEVFKAGPVGSDACAKCGTHCSPVAKFCSDCGALIPREKTPAEVLAGAKKKLGVKERVQ
jgi:hypothetical protein